MRQLRMDIVDTVSGKKEQFTFASSPVKVGRGRMNDLVLDFDFVSQVHAAISFSDDQAVYMDLGSRNGSAIDGTKAKKNRITRLSPSAEVQIGTLKLSFAWAEPAADGPGERPRGPLVFSPPPTSSDGKPARSGAVKVTRVLDEETSHGPAASPAGVSSSLQTFLARPPAAPPAVDPSSATERVPPPNLAPPSLSLAPPSLNLAPPPVPSLPVPEPLPRWSSQEPLPPEPNVSLPWAVPEAGYAASSSGVVSAPSLAGASLAGAAFAPAASSGPSEIGQATADVAWRFVRDFVALRTGISSVAQDLGLGAAQIDGPLGQSDAAGEILAYLTNEPARATSRLAEVERAFAYLFAHHVAVVGALREGLDNLLGPWSVSPQGGAHDPGRIAAVSEALRYSYLSIMAGHGFGPSAPPPSVARGATPVGGMPQPLEVAGGRFVPQATRELPESDALAAEPPSAVRKLVDVSLEGTRQTWALAKPRMTIGRQEDTDVPLPFPAVSRVHAALTVDDAGWSISDLGSSNGTFVNGAPTKTARLKLGDIIQIGPVQLQFA